MPETPIKTLLVEMLRRSGPMTFAQYMALCLYHPEHGYYTRGGERTGVRGDYFTSPDLHPIFARLLARQAAEMWEILDRPTPFTWVEMGPGRGWFARDFLGGAREALPDFFASLHYFALEPSALDQARLRERLSEDGLGDRVRVFSNLEEIEPITGCFFSNELVDAFPVSVVTRARGRLKEIYVTLEGNALAEKLGPISNPAIAGAVARYANRLEEGHRVEVGLAAVRWMRSVAEKLARGFVVTIDYGNLAERLYTPDRPQGTLMAYRRHLASEDYYAASGEQDLTAHVNFSALIDAGKETGLDFTGFTTQEKLLMALGEENAFADLYEPGQSEVEKLQARLKLKRLIHPEGMGGIFKVLVQHRGAGAPQLTGLKFS
ncbi:MAG TPA: SAM-dependent methyltransferase [Terriglobia bacterium]|nr:SAM-dependent methyltransferase [Terriglobia bacterium]